jgi:two-component system chemotaxis sensor kinase CheA
VEALKGMIQVDSTPKKGCTFRVQLGTSLATAHVLIVIVNHVSYAVPLEFVQTTKLVSMSEVFTIEGKDTIVWNNQPISVARLANLLELDYEQPALSDDHQLVPCIILKVGDDTLGLFVDELIDEQDVVLKPQSRLLKRVRNVAGATILGTGEVCMVLNPHDLIKSVRKLIGSFTGSVITHQDFSNGEIGHTDTGHRKTTILLAEDSIATRTQEKRILEAAGYEVVTCVDGLDAFNKLRVGAFDAVVSDIQMPNMDGLTLTSKIRENKEYNELPIILVTSLASEEDKKRGAEAGANAYITKGNFNQEVLLDTLRRLV